MKKIVNTMPGLVAHQKNPTSYRLVIVQLTIQPGASELPVSLDASGGHTEQLRGLGNGKTSEETQLHDARFARRFLRELTHRFVQRYQIQVPSVGHQLGAFDGYALMQSTMLFTAASPGMINKYPSNGLG